MPGPLIVRIAGRDDVGDRRVGMAAEIDALHAQDVVAAAAAAGRAGIVIEQVHQPFVVERCARHADRGVHAQRQCVALGVLAVGADHRRRQAMPFIERRRAGRRIGVRAEPHALDPVAILEAGQIAEQRVFQNRHEIALEEDAGRLAARILHDLDVVRRRRVARDAGALERQRVGDRRKRPAAPPAPHRADVDRVVRRNRIEVVPGRKASVGQLVGAAEIFVRRLAHRHQHDPVASRRRLRRPLHDLDDLGDRVQPGDRDAAARLEAFAVGMRMGVEQARNDRSALEVDEPGRGRRILQQRRAVADRHDVTRSHRDGLRRSRAAIERDDFAAVQDQIGRKHVCPSREVE